MSKSDGTIDSADRHEEESLLVELKMRKSRAKANFTRNRHALIELLADEDSPKEELKDRFGRLETALEQATEAISEVVKFLREKKRTSEMIKITDEIDTLNDLFDQTVKQYHNFNCDSSSEGSFKETESKTVSTDMYKQLKRVSIPIFTGVKKQYEFWKSAFDSCVDSTNATPEYKFLQLRQYLGGEALKAIEGLGHSPAAYDAAKEKLQRKYGGKRRQVNRFLEELDKFPIIKYENAKMIEKFADLLEVAIINMKESDTNDLNSGFMYLQLLKKLPESMITKFQRWIFENSQEETVENLKTWVLQESEFHSIALETKYGLDTKGDKYEKPKDQRSYFSDDRHDKKERLLVTCKVCNGQHNVWDCKVMKEIPISERWQHAKNSRLCFRCLGNNHSGRDCRKTRKCGIDGCVKVHHRLLHQTESLKEQNQSQTFTSTTKQNVYIALRTIPVILHANGRELKVNALLDDGSTRTYLNQDVAEELGIGNRLENVNVTTLNGRTENIETMSVKFGLNSLDRNTKVEIEANTTQQVTGNLKPIDWNKYSKNRPHLNSIRFPSIGRKPKVDILIGLDYSELHRSLGELSGEEGSPTARLTPLGWTCVGPVDIHSERNDMNLFTFHADLDVNQEINETLKKFWEIETVENRKDTLSREDSKVMEIMKTTTYDKESRRYEVPIPWKDNKSELKDNYKMAVNRLESTERKLNKNPILKATYAENIEKYQEKGYISKVTDSDTTPKWYMPHFPVIRHDKATTKVRMVFDASAKYNSLSLNDVIYQGPKLQNELFDVLLRFRRQEVALICDIQEMYLQVGLLPPDRPYHRFLWRPDSSADPDVYQFERVVFGINASPFLAQYVSQENARTFQSQYPLAAESVMKSTYMDDTMDSVSNEQIGIVLYHELSSLWKMAGMTPRKWMSNSPEVLSHIPQTERAFEIDLSKEELPLLKTLGLNWNSESDMFTFYHTEPKDDMKVTKRNVLKTIATLYDPLGFLVPYTVRAKIIMQNTWLSGCDWDDELDDALASDIQKWFSELQDLKQIVVPRCLNVTADSELHTFVDSSNDAYGAVVYHRKPDSTNETNIVAAKGRVAPLKSHSIPRLELLAAVLGLTLTIAVCSALGIDMHNTTYWSDSMNVLYWIHSQSRQYKPFVGNRIGTIHEHTSPDQWRYVPSKQNPADTASRGTTVKQLSEDEAWWQGPEFLRRSPESWPKNQFAVDESAKIEMKSVHRNFVTMNSSNSESRLDPTKFSSWNRLVRISAWVHRFIDNCQTCKAERRLSSELSVQELEQSSSKLIITAQVESFPDEYQGLAKGKVISVKSKLAPLNPKLDTDGIMRSDSRLKFTNCISYDTKFPIILPRKHAVTKLIVKHCHESTNHGGTNSTLAKLSSRFWVMSAREEIRDWENTCAVCKLSKAKGSTQIMSTIPDERVGQSLRAFTNTAVDYAGPFITKQGRGKTRLKRYLCVFTCTTTRAIHLEVANSMDTSAFMNALYRFTSRRGVPKTIISDNGTNFVGCVRELKELYDKLDKDAIIRQAAVQRIDWKFIPPNAPHFGGIHESMVKSAKRAVYTILSKADITDEELITAVTGAEGLINSRPLTYQSSNPKDNVVLTPNHFLIGQIGGHFAPEIEESSAGNVKKRWRRIQELLRHFWKRWIQEYLPTLGSRRKWHRSSRDFQVDDVVLIVDPDTPRGQWPLGRITKVFTGPDGHVRVVDLQTKTSVFRRPISRLSLVVESV